MELRENLDMNIDTLDMDFQDNHLNRSQSTAEG